MKKFLELLSGKRVNIFLGAGTSSKIIPTLSLCANNLSFVDLLESKLLTDQNRKKLIVFYYHWWVLAGDAERVREDSSYEKVLNEYLDFIISLISFLSNESTSSPRRINLFTTNFDPLFEMAFDEILQRNASDCYFCDGGRGFVNRHFSIKNFYLNISHSGYFDKYKREIPTINLFKMHGSISWINTSGSIEFDPSNPTYVVKVIKEIVNNIGSSVVDAIKDVLFTDAICENREELITHINDQLSQIEMERDILEASIKELKGLPIINPMDWKFEQTVFDQNYYQLIRALSYELENENSVFIALGSSFSDPHINEIIKRSLTNPKLLPIIICFDIHTLRKIEQEFPGNQCHFLPTEKELNDNTRGTLTYLTELLQVGDFYE